MPPDPFALSACGRHLVAGSLGDDLPLELGKRQQDIEGQAAQRRRGVELLGYGNEARSALLEGLHDAGEIEQGAAETVHLVDDHAVDLPGFDIS